MNKYKIIAIVNFLLGLLFAYFLVFTLNGLFLPGAPYYYTIVLPAVFLVSAFINCLIAYRLFINKEESIKQFFTYLIVALHTVGWLVIQVGLLFTTFAGLFFVSLILLIVYLAFAIVTIFILSKTNNKIAFLFLLLQ